jgi:hypothetical protein
MLDKQLGYLIGQLKVLLLVHVVMGHRDRPVPDWKINEKCCC